MTLDIFELGVTGCPNITTHTVRRHAAEALHITEALHDKRNWTCLVERRQALDKRVGLRRGGADQQQRRRARRAVGVGAELRPPPRLRGLQARLQVARAGEARHLGACGPDMIQRQLT